MASKSLDIIIGAKDRTSGPLKRIERNLGKFAAGFLAFSTVSSFARSAAEDLAMVRRETMLFERQLTELFSLGNNASESGGIRKRVLEISNAYGIARGEIAKSLFDLQSGTANLDESQRKQLLQSALELREVYGAALPDALRGLTKTYQIYGDQVDRVSDLQRKVAFLAEEGVVNFTEVSTLLPDVASAADAVGTSLDEVLASLVVATQRGGDTGKTFTGVRNVFLRLNNAEKEGIHLTGTFTERLAQLNREASAETLKKIFGDEALAAANNLLKSTEQIDGVLRRIGTNLPDIGDKIAQSLDDPIRRLSKISELIHNLKDNGFVGQSADQMRLVNQAGAFDASLSNQSQTYDLEGIAARLLSLPVVKQAAGGIDYASGGPISDNTFKKLITAQIDSGQLALADATLEELERITGRTADTLREALGAARIANRDDSQGPLNSRLVSMIEGLAGKGNTSAAENFARKAFTDTGDYRFMDVFFRAVTERAERSIESSPAHLDLSPIFDRVRMALEAGASATLAQQADEAAGDFLTRTLASLGDVDAQAALAAHRVREEAQRVTDGLTKMLESATLSDADRAKVEATLSRLTTEAEKLAKRASDEALGLDRFTGLGPTRVAAEESRFLTGAGNDPIGTLARTAASQLEEAKKLNETTERQVQDIAAMARAIASGVPLIPANFNG